ncbi:unnamed protein product [Paramecium octaurelia]|uniref:Uncharacterized protein n=1 Tax=Paramecium octaurelia TaxID=43137 RepID=A0A8S1U956_PAROT|nr:unnamed protein product [Paramecium octaurelia]
MQQTFQKHKQNSLRVFEQYFSICLQIIQDVNLTQTQNSIYEIFARQLDETFSLNSSQVENDTLRACKSQLLKRKVQNKFENMGSEFSNQIAEVPHEMSNDNCSLCQLQFEKQEIQYSALLISYTNVIKRINAMPQKIPTKLINRHFLNCGIEQKHNIGEFQYLRCPTCLSPYNFTFVSPIHIKTANDQILIENLDFFLGTITSKKLMEYYKRFQVEKGELEIPKLLDEIFSQVLCSLLFQLLSDLNKFKLKNTHLLLQDVLALLRILFQSNQTTVLEEVVQNDQQAHVRILNLILQFMIKQNNINDLKSGLCLIFNNNINQSAIIQALTENLIISQIEQKSLPYDLERISKDLKQHYINKFQLNFKKFLLRYYLSPCQKQKCKFLPLQRMENQEENQYLFFDLSQEDVRSLLWKTIKYIIWKFVQTLLEKAF